MISLFGNNESSVFRFNFKVSKVECNQFMFKDSRKIKIYDMGSNFDALINCVVVYVLV